MKGPAILNLISEFSGLHLTVTATNVR